MPPFSPVQETSRATGHVAPSSPLPSELGHVPSELPLVPEGAVGGAHRRGCGRGDLWSDLGAGVCCAEHGQDREAPEPRGAPGRARRP